MKYLIVGLGNPGAEYENTRHNIGFSVVDTIVEENNLKFENSKLGSICRLKYKGRILVFLKPNTFMNLSGKSVNYWMKLEKLSVDNLLIITDDLSLPFGQLRLRAKGSSAGHNGLDDICSYLGGNIYPRLRFGIGNNFLRGGQSDYVLGSWDNDQEEQIKGKIDESIKVVYSFCTTGIDRTMNNLNRK
jgi:PTH1 family peptidyl-tRNA hydrolase|tara:strand:+ start:16 stop:579 length:564 start_codon:yes stop_codon:yes gene_type:complete